MCLEFASCFGGRTDDYGGEQPNRKEEHRGTRRGRNRRGNHGSAYNGHAADHRLAPQAACHHQPPATNIAPPKLPTWQNKAGNDAYTARLQEEAADHRNNAAMDYHHYPTTTAS
ncbi:hypothetical protein VPH35_057693 [Triticum aestivum]